MGKFKIVKPGISIVETTPVPIRHIDDIGRIDIIGDKVVVTLIELQPSEDGGAPEAIVIDKVAFRSTAAVDMVQFFWSALAQAGIKIESRKPLVMQ